MQRQRLDQQDEGIYHCIWRNAARRLEIAEIADGERFAGPRTLTRTAGCPRCSHIKVSEDVRQ
jgi:hypothetical protein